MAATRTPGITIAADGNYSIDKCHRGIRICLRLGASTLEQAEVRLKREVAHVEIELRRRAHARPLFRGCAARYLAQRQERRSLATMQIHVRLMMPTSVTWSRTRCTMRRWRLSSRHAVRDQHGAARQQCLRPAMDLESTSARARPQRLRRTC